MTSEEKKEYARQWRENNREKTAEYAARYRAANREKIAEKRAEWASKNQDRLKRLKADWYRANKTKSQLSSKKSAYLRLYGITLEERDALLAKQSGRCAICLCEDPGGKGWHLDHCHKSNKVRGVLCNNCNLMLGYAKDNLESLMRAIKYLEGA